LFILRVNKGKEYGRCENEKKSVKPLVWKREGNREKRRKK